MRLSYMGRALAAILVMGTLASCRDDNRSDLDLSGDTYITSLALDGYDADIDNVAKTAVVGVPSDFDASAMKLTSIELSEGATCDIAVGDKIDCTVPRSIRVTNGDVFTDYLLTVTHDNATFKSFTVNGQYQGTIDNTERTIRVFVPMNADLTAMTVSYELSEGATATPEQGSLVDFTNPVEFVATYRSAKVKYLVSVIKDDMSQEPKAFIGNAASVAALGDEARAAAQWMLDNVPNSIFVSLQDVLDGKVKLNEFKMVWCHLDFLDWPGVMWDTRDLFNDYYIKGGNILASRDGARYINDVWRIALDQQSPNNMFGGENAETLAADLGFTITGHEDHPLYAGIAAAGGKINMVSKGCSNTNRTLQWCIDAEPYFGVSGWEERTGAKALAYDDAGDTNHVTIAEFPSREVLKGYQSGVVVTVGTPAYEWYQANGENSFRNVMEVFTKNAINYLCK